MHQEGICHRDLNPNNIMIADNFQIKIIDFSVSKWFKINEASTAMWTPTGTPAYKAPEIYQGGAYQEPVDMWAAGVILYECLSGKKPFIITKQ
jgi:calcium-dependent protein kinase